MSKLMSFKQFLLIVIAGVNLATNQHSLAFESGVSVGGSKAKNVILMIGDGMGLPQVSAAMQLTGKSLNLERAAAIGLMKTGTAIEQITDSAAGATAFSIGEKTYNGAVGVGLDGTSKPTILEQLADKGVATGLIATSAITHATPASFYAHVPSRDDAYAIAEALATAPVDLFIGGGQSYFERREDEQKGTPDDRNLIKEMKENGVTILSDLESLTSSKGRAGLFIADGHPKSVALGRGDLLVKAILPAVSYLQKQSDKGFFLVVEGSQIDWGGHENNIEYVISELIDFDAALGEALDFAAQQNDTLIVVTADHETGGLTMPFKGEEGDAKYAKATPDFSTRGHTSAMVPVYAFGVGAEGFTGVYENTAIYRKILTAMGQ